MKGVICIEAKWDNTVQKLRFWKNIINSGAPGLGDIFYWPPDYWVARITGADPKYHYARKFIKGKKDYRKANSVGSRGIFMYYFLDSGFIYEVKDFSRRYFCTVDDDGNISIITREEVDTWAKSILESVS